MDNSPSATRHPKQARAIRTRERILEQAEEAFAAEGFEAASLTSDILEPAGISVGSFYHQFTDKRAVLHALLDERGGWREASAAAESTAASQTGFSDAVRCWMLHLLDDIDEHPAMWWIHYRELHSSDADVRELIERSWASRLGPLTATLASRVDDPALATPGRLGYATSGLTGVLRIYLSAGQGERRRMRGHLDDIVAACVASLSR